MSATLGEQDSQLKPTAGPSYLSLRRLAFALRHPDGAFSYLVKGRHSFLRWQASLQERQFVRAIRRLAGASQRDIEHLRAELMTSGLESSIERTVAVNGLPSEFIHNRAPYGWFYYALFRLLKPRIVLETGVWFGVSTAFILQALERNRAGALYSIDLPNASYVTQIGSHRGGTAGDSVGAPANTGVLVPTSLRSRWFLRLGRSREQLLPLLESLGKIDIFIHDSEHTYECMMFEFSTAWRFLTPGGLLISDDIGWNDAFTDFARSIEGHRFLLEIGPGRYCPRVMGMLIKPKGQ